MNYIFYSSETGLKVARSANGILGPYEGQTTPLVEGFYEDASRVSGLSNDEVLVFSSFRGLLEVYGATLEWSERGWPSVKGFVSNSTLF